MPFPVCRQPGKTRENWNDTFLKTVVSSRATDKFVRIHIVKLKKPCSRYVPVECVFLMPEHFQRFDFLNRLCVFNSRVYFDSRLHHTKVSVIKKLQGCG